MATHRLPILSWVARPETTATASESAELVSFDTLATNDVWDRQVYRFPDQATKDVTLHGGFVVPKNYVGTPKFVIVWTTTVVVGSVSWAINYRTVGGDNTTSLDQNTAEESLGQVVVVAATALNRLETSIAASALFAVDEEIEYWLIRFTLSDVLDTAAGDAILFNFLFEYADA